MEKLSASSIFLSTTASLVTIRRHPFLGTCATYFETSAFGFPRPEGFWESRRYHCPRRTAETYDKWLVLSDHVRHLKLDTERNLSVRIRTEFKRILNIQIRHRFLKVHRLTIYMFIKNV